MKTKRLLLSLAWCLLSLKTASGCAVITVPKLTEFDPAEYIFIGEVTGVVNPISSEKFHGDAWGIKVRVKDSVFLPRRPATHFVVVPFELESDCKDKGRSSEDLLRYFPVGSEVRVVAKESKYVESKMADGNVRLEILPHNLGSIARNYSSEGRSVSSAGSIYDYRSYVPGNPCRVEQKDMPDYEAHMSLPDFEYRKDLLKLKKAKSERMRLEVLERLAYFPSDDYPEIVAQYIKNRGTVERLSRRWRAWRRVYMSKVVVSC